jgi:hypothetical protein
MQPVREETSVLSTSVQVTKTIAIADVRRPVLLRQLKMRVKPEAQGLLMFAITIKGQPFRALIDSGANGMFLSSRVVTQLKLKTVAKGHLDPVKMADGTSVDSPAALRLGYNMGNYRDIDTFHVLDLPTFDVVIGVPWLHRMDPTIHWKRRTMAVKHKGVTHRYSAISQQGYMQVAGLIISALELKNSMQRGEEVYSVSLKEILDDTLPVSDRPAIRPGLPLPPGWQERLDEKIKSYSDVISPDPDWKPDFPPPRTVDHHIERVPGVPIPQRPMGRMGQDELEELRIQLEDFVERGYIVPSASEFASPVLMVKRPGEKKLRFCLDYRAS